MHAQSELEPTIELRALIDAHFDFVWRSLRRLGVDDAALDDAAQQVWIVVSKHAEPVQRAKARSFLFAIALRVASDMRKSARRRRHVADEAAVAQAADERPLADERIDQGRARQILDEMLDAMPGELRVVFILFELEQLTSSEIAEALTIPLGTVASRLRRGRELFTKLLRRRARSAR